MFVYEKEKYCLYACMQNTRPTNVWTYSFNTLILRLVGVLFFTYVLAYELAIN